MDQGSAALSVLYLLAIGFYVWLPMLAVSVICSTVGLWLLVGFVSRLRW